MFKWLITAALIALSVHLINYFRLITWRNRVFANTLLQIMPTECLPRRAYVLSKMVNEELFIDMPVATIQTILLKFEQRGLVKQASEVPSSIPYYKITDRGMNVFEEFTPTYKK